MLELKIKRLSDTAHLPTKAHPEDACFDIYAHLPNATYHEWNGGIEVKERHGIKIMPGETVMIDTGFATAIPNGYYAAIYARSGLGIKQGLRPAQGTGIIDANYRGEWKVGLHNDSNEVRIVQNGDRIAQFAILPVPNVALEEVNELDPTERGDGGFGSSGK